MKSETEALRQILNILCKKHTIYSIMTSSERRSMFIAEKTMLITLVHKIKDVLKDELIVVIVFGSRVRGDFCDTSDFDILFVVKKKSFALLTEINKIITEEEIHSLTNFSVLIKGLDSFNQEKKYNTPFYQDLKNEGKIIYGRIE